MGMKPRKKPTMKNTDKKKDDAQLEKQAQLDAQLEKQAQLLAMALDICKDPEEAYEVLLGTAIRFSHVLVKSHENVRRLVEANLAQLRGDESISLFEVIDCVRSMIRADLGEDPSPEVVADILMNATGNFVELMNLDTVPLYTAFTDGIEFVRGQIDHHENQKEEKPN